MKQFHRIGHICRVILYHSEAPFADKKSAIETSLTKLKDAHKALDLQLIDSGISELNAAWTAASEEMYKATQEGAGQQAGPGEQPGSGNGHENAAGGTENVTDAEFEEVK